MCRWQRVDTSEERKHKRFVADYFSELASASLRSDDAQTLRERLLKYQDKLVIFLDYDGIPWNNNNAENAIKQFAYFRENRTAVLREAGLRDFLVLLSVYQTCRYKGISFLKFLLSRERDIDAFTGKRRTRRHSALTLYPKGFTPPHFAGKNPKAK
jgi:hypothetical protein